MCCCFRPCMRAWYPVLEAFASGLPVVTSGAGALKEVGGDAPGRGRGPRSPAYARRWTSSGRPGAPRRPDRGGPDTGTGVQLAENGGADGAGVSDAAVCTVGSLPPRLRMSTLWHPAGNQSRSTGSTVRTTARRITARRDSGDSCSPSGRRAGAVHARLRNVRRGEGAGTPTRVLSGAAVPRPVGAL